MLQRTFDFDKEPTPQPQISHVAESTSLPPPAPKKLPLPLVRPDRQFTYGGAIHFEWPPPEHDHDTITVDRIHADIDGPSHRFVICRGDKVEVFFAPGNTHLGIVVGISHRNNEVRVAFSDGSDGIWVSTSCVYPWAEDPSTQTAPKVLLSSVVASVNGKYGQDLTDADRVPAAVAPYTFDEYKQFRRQLAEGTLPYSEYHSQFARLLTSAEAITSELKSRFKATELAVIASRMGNWDARRSTKDQNAASIYRKMLSSFVLEGTVSFSMGERYEDAVTKKVEAVTEEDFLAAFAERRAAAEEHQQALNDPRTFHEFRTFLREKNESDLTDEQLARYDTLHADITRERRASELATTVEQFRSEEIDECEFQIKTGYHEKRQCQV